MINYPLSMQIVSDTDFEGCNVLEKLFASA